MAPHTQGCPSVLGGTLTGPYRRSSQYNNAANPLVNGDDPSVLQLPGVYTSTGRFIRPTMLLSATCNPDYVYPTAPTWSPANEAVRCAR